MTLWDKFFESDRIEDYDNADLYGTDTEGK